MQSTLSILADLPIDFCIQRLFWSSGWHLQMQGCNIVVMRKIGQTDNPEPLTQKD
jgi:hypothetical protein